MEPEKSLGSDHEELWKPQKAFGFYFACDAKPLVNFDENNNITLIVFHKDQSVFINRIDFSGAKF